MNMDDLDTPVDEALLMGDEPQDEPEDEQPEGEQPEDAAPEQEEGEADEKEPPKEKAESDLIPKWRFNEINEERKQLRAELEALKAQRQPEQPKEDAPQPPSVTGLRDKESDLEAELENAMLEGDDERRKEIRAELRSVRSQIDTAIRIEAESRVEQRMSARMEAEAHQRLAVELETKHPAVFSAQGNPAAVEMVLELRDSYIARGMPMTKALQAAANKVLPLFGNPSAPTPDTPDPRKAEAIRKGADTNNATPPRGSGVGNRAQAPREDINSISQGKWEKMTPAEREKLLSA